MKTDVSKFQDSLIKALNGSSYDEHELKKLVLEEIQNSFFNNEEIKEFVSMAILEIIEAKDKSTLKKVVKSQKSVFRTKADRDKNIAFYVVLTVVNSSRQDEKPITITKAKKKAADCFNVSEDTVKKAYETHRHLFLFNRNVGTKEYKIGVKGRAIAYQVFSRVDIPHLHNIKRMNLKDACKVVSHDYNIPIPQIKLFYKQYLSDLEKEFSVFIKS